MVSRKPSKEKICSFKDIVLGCLEPGDSHFWAGLMATKKYFFRYGFFSINDGSHIDF
jgi:hypothetical protein